VKTENPGACVTVKCKACKIAIVLQLPVVPSAVCKVSINPIIHFKTCVVSHSQVLTSDIIVTCWGFVTNNCGSRITRIALLDP
jgi:hypothetical protein